MSLEKEEISPYDSVFVTTENFDNGMTKKDLTLEPWERM